MRKHRLGTLAVAAMLLASPALAQTAEDKSTARTLGDDGWKALDNKDYKAAEDKFRRADALYHAPTLTLGYARAEAGLGKFVEAWEAYHRIVLENVTSSAAFAHAVADAKKEMPTVEGRRARVTITVTGSDSPNVTLDDAPVRKEALGVERFVNPGAHVVKVSADGFQAVTRNFTVSEGAAQPVPITLERAASGAAAAVPPGGESPATAGQGETAAPNQASSSATSSSGLATGSTSSGSSMKTIGLVVLGVGAVGLVVGGVTGFMAMGKHSDLSNACPNGTCGTAQQSDVDSYHTLGTISTIGFIAGGVGVAAGAALFLLAPKRAATSTAGWISPYVGPGSVGATGRF